MSENVNFHMTFPPTPAYIGCLLKIADGRVRTVAEIAEETGIPEGASSGKVRPHIQYASYMGLLNSSDFTRTPLGKIVYLEDCMLTEKLTQMLCHVNMISPTGAPMWRYLFHELFPENLSDYLFFDGERWSASNSKAEDIENSINLILGIKTFVKMMDHLKDGSDGYKTSVISKIQRNLKTTTDEEKRLKTIIVEKNKQLESNKEKIDKLIRLFNDVNYMYIADGHHRIKSAVEVCLKRRRENPNYTGKEGFNYFLAIAYPDSELDVLDYNRTVKDLNGLSKEEFLKAIQKKFIIEKTPNNERFKPNGKHTFGMYIDNEWFKLKAREGTFDKNDPTDRLDVSILQNNLLSPILGIDDPTKSDRIEFIGGIRGLRELEKRANTDMRVSFAMYPTTIEDIMSIADAGKIMPPKSTWFEPKPRSGLFIHKLTEIHE